MIAYDKFLVIRDSDSECDSNSDSDSDRVSDKSSCNDFKLRITRVGVRTVNQGQDKTRSQRSGSTSAVPVKLTPSSTDILNELY